MQGPSPPSVKIIGTHSHPCGDGDSEEDEAQASKQDSHRLPIPMLDEQKVHTLLALLHALLVLTPASSGRGGQSLYAKFRYLGSSQSRKSNHLCFTR